MQSIETFSTSKLSIMKDVVSVLTVQNLHVKLSQQLQTSVLINDASFLTSVFNIIAILFTSA